ncbi:MAG TPA: hypothetical protein VK530_13285, partial [Candidatus Acidoferrum sp.]|nr:hypothetical protein [Candidatus Acidoferrum sp.]
NTGPGTVIERRHNEYGQMILELLKIDGSSLIPVWQGWDSAGRRSQADGMNFTYRADGLMAGVNASTFGYGNNGLLTGRTNGSRVITVDQRDSMGRPQQRTTCVNGSAVLTETWGWTGDGMPSSYIAARTDFTDTRNFEYAPLTRRLTQETLHLTNGAPTTNSYTFDHGTAGGLGVLTKVGQASSLSPSNNWSAGLDDFSRITAETNSIVRRSADGFVNGAATLRGYVNGQPIDLRYDSRAAGPWYANLPLASGSTNTLTVYADHPSGGFTTNRAATFTVGSGAFDKEESQYDGAGNVTNRVWKRADGQVVRSQSLTWNGFGRLAKVTERDASSNGFSFVSVFDGLGRQVRTIETTVSNNVALSANPAPLIVTYHYDPQVEFMIIGVGVSQGAFHRQDWMAFGPDASGSYGGMHGIGGLETIMAAPFNFSTLAINDGFGNVVGTVSNGVTRWTPSRVNLYAPVEGYAPPRISLNTPLHASLTWRTRPRNVAGLVQLGARPYDPFRRAFLAADPLGHASDGALNTAFNGNPAFYFDADGRLSAAPRGSGFYHYLPDGRQITVSLASAVERAVLAAGGTGEEAYLAGWGGGGRPTASYSQPSRSWGSTAADAFLNADLLQESWQELSNPDFSTGIGWATFTTAGVGLVAGTLDAGTLDAGTLDAGANILTLGGKSAVTSSVKTGLKEGFEILAKDSIRTTIHAGAQQGGDAFGYYMRMAERLDVSTAPNAATFYSGRGNRELAENFARANEKVTLEMTSGGAWLDQQKLFDTATSGLTSDQARAVWEAMSRRYAENASGTAVGFVEGASARGIFNRVEYPALQSNPAIGNVVTGGR